LIIRFLTLWHNSSSKGSFFQVTDVGNIVVSNVTVKGSNTSPTSYINYDFAVVSGGFYDYSLYF
jgi:hypothetical protein